MPRPRRSQDSKEQLLELGIQMMSRKGYAGIGLQQILSEAKIPKGSFYNYFSSKENFAAAVLERYMQKILGLVEGQRGRDDIAAIDRLISIHKFLIEAIRASEDKCGCLLGVFAAELGATAPEIHAVMKEHKDTWLSHYADILKLAQDQGSVRTDMKPDALASLVWSQWQGALLKLQIDQSVDDFEASFFAMIDVIRKPKIQMKEMT